MVVLTFKTSQISFIICAICNIRNKHTPIVRTFWCLLAVSLWVTYSIFFLRAMQGNILNYKLCIMMFLFSGILRIFGSLKSIYYLWHTLTYDLCKPHACLCEPDIWLFWDLVQMSAPNNAPFSGVAEDLKGRAACYKQDWNLGSGSGFRFV